MRWRQAVKTSILFKDYRTEGLRSSLLFVLTLIKLERASGKYPVIIPSPSSGTTPSRYSQSHGRKNGTCRWYLAGVVEQWSLPRQSVPVSYDRIVRVFVQLYVCRSKYYSYRCAFLHSGYLLAALCSTLSSFESQGLMPLKRHTDIFLYLPPLP